MVVAAKAPTGGPEPERSSSVAYSPRPRSMSEAGRCATPTHRAMSPPWNRPNVSARWLTRKRAGAVLSAPGR